METIYRRRTNSDTWHFVQECKQFPIVDYVEKLGKKPGSGELCDQCISLTKKTSAAAKTGKARKTTKKR
jgi:hypothetical protein